MEDIRVDTKEKRERDLLWIFDLGLILKGIDGALELIAAFVITFVPPHVVVSVANFVTGGELSEGPDDLVGRVLRSAAHAFSVSNHVLVSVYLALHGAVKLGLVAGIFAGKKIAYPLFMLSLVIFGSYEVFVGLAHAHLLLLVVGVFDFLLLVLTAYEFKRRYPNG